MSDYSENVFVQIIKIDLQNHQPSIDEVHRAGREIIKSELGVKAKNTRDKLDTVHQKLETVRTKIRDRKILLEDALKDVSNCLLSFKCV